MGILLDKKQIWVIFLSSKWVVKKQRQLATSATHLAQELLMNIQCCGGSRTFAKEMRTLKMRSLVAGLYQSEVDNDSWEPLLKLMFLQLHEKLPRNSVSAILWSFGIWSKLKRVKKLDKWVPRELTGSPKKLLLWSVIFFYSMQQLQIISRFNCDMWQKVYRIWQLVMTSSVAGLRRSSQALPQDKLAPKKVVVTVWGSAFCLIHYSFLNPKEAITSEKYAQQINEIHQTLQHLQPPVVNRKGQFFSMTVPDHRSHNHHFKNWTNWASKFCFILHIHLTSHQLATPCSSILTTFCRQNGSITNRMQKMFSKSSLNPEEQIFMPQE